MDYLIDEVKIDGKQSYEDVILPVEKFYAAYGDRIAVLGGLDVDILAAGTQQQTRERTRQILEACFNTGRYALGSGNTVTNYCKIENILAMFDEAYTFI
jgi:uroporphyrinogen decarboxylase